MLLFGYALLFDYIVITYSLIVCDPTSISIQATSIDCCLYHYLSHYSHFPFYAMVLFQWVVQQCLLPFIHPDLQQCWSLFSYLFQLLASLSSYSLYSLYTLTSLTITTAFYLFNYDVMANQWVLPLAILDVMVVVVLYVLLVVLLVVFLFLVVLLLCYCFMAYFMLTIYIVWYSLTIVSMLSLTIVSMLSVTVVITLRFACCC